MGRRYCRKADILPSMPTTARLNLRRFMPADAAALSLIWSDPEVYRYLPFDEPRDVAQAERSIKSIEDHWDQYGYGVWAVCDKTTGALLGYCGLRYLEDVSATEVLYGYAKASWGQGIASEAAQAAVRFGFEQAGLKQLIALAHPENVASRRVMEKLGMSYMGRVFIFGLDAVKYALLAPWSFS